MKSHALDPEASHSERKPSPSETLAEQVGGERKNQQRMSPSGMTGTTVTGAVKASVGQGAPSGGEIPRNKPNEPVNRTTPGPFLQVMA